MLIKFRHLALFFLLSLPLSMSAGANEIKLNGEMIQGGLITGSVAPGSVVILNEREVSVTPEGEFVFGFGRDAAATQTLYWGASKSALNKRSLSVKQRDYPTQYIEGVPQNTVNPSKDKLARIKQETALVKRARKANSSMEFFLQPFSVPSDGRITGVYGSQRVYNGVPKRPHFGIDYAAPLGAPVYAPASGKISLVHDDMYYSGGTLIMDHGYGVSSTFIHLSEILVKEGDEIAQGDLIARVGQGGRSTGPHLDWRVNWFEVRVDPQLVLKK